MIQEISPHKLFNQFNPHPSRDHDFVLVYENGCVLLKNENDHITYPRAHMIEGELKYLFTIDHDSFYLYCGRILPQIDGYRMTDLAMFRIAKPQHLSYAGILGAQLYRFYTCNQFCGRCGVRMEESDAERALVCPACNYTAYPKISPCVIVGVIDGERLVLTKYNGRSYKKYALVAGFMEFGETPEDTVRREVMEEVGLKVKNIRYYKSQPWPVTDTLLLGFFCDVDGGTKIQIDENELSAGVWMERDQIPPSDSDVSLTNEMIDLFRENKVK